MTGYITGVPNKQHVKVEIDHLFVKKFRVYCLVTVQADLSLTDTKKKKKKVYIFLCEKF